MAWDEGKFNAALANKLKNQDIHAQVEGFNANTQRLQAATQADLLPSQQAMHTAAAQAGLMNAGTERGRLGASMREPFTGTEIGQLGLGSSGFTAGPQPTPGMGLRTPTTYNDIMGTNPLDPNKNRYPVLGGARGGPMGDVDDDTGQDTRKAMVRPGEYMVDPHAVGQAFGGGDYHQGVRNLNRIIHDATGYQPGATYAKKGKAGFARSGNEPAKKKKAAAPREMTDAEWGEMAAKPPQPQSLRNPRELIDARQEETGKSMSDKDWNESRRTSWTPGAPPAMPVTDAQWNATQRGGREPLRTRVPESDAAWNAMVGGVRGYPNLPNNDPAVRDPIEVVSDRAGVPITGGVPRTPQGGAYKSALAAAPAVPLMSTAEQLAAIPMPTKPAPSNTLYDQQMADPNLRMGAEDPGLEVRNPVAAATQKAEAAKAAATAAAAAAAATAAPTGVRKQYDMSEDIGVSSRTKPIPRGYANFDEGTTPWAVRNKMQAGGQPGEQVTLNYGPGYEKPGDKIYAQANAAGRFNSFSDRPQAAPAPVPAAVQRTTNATMPQAAPLPAPGPTPYLQQPPIPLHKIHPAQNMGMAFGGVVPRRGLRMAKGGQVPGFQTSGAEPWMDEFMAAQQEGAAARAAAQQAAQANAAATAAENARNAQAAAAALRTGPTTGAIPTGMNAPPPGAGPQPLPAWRAAISGGNTTPVSQALGQTARAGINAVKTIAPAAGQVLRAGALYVPSEGLRQGLVGAWTTPIEDYAKRGGFELGEEGTVGGELKNIGIRAAGVGSDIGRGTLNALALPANLLKHGLDTKKWYDYGEENFSDVKDKMWEDRHMEELMARKAKLEGGGGTPGVPSTPSRDQAIADFQQRGKDWYARQQAEAAGGGAGGAGGAGAPGGARPSLRDQLAKQYWDLENTHGGIGSVSRVAQQHNILGYLSQIDAGAASANATALHQQMLAGSAHEKDMAEMIDKSFVKPQLKDGKPTGEYVADPETRNRFFADIAAQGGDPYHMTRAQYQQLRKDWDSQESGMAGVNKAWQGGAPGRFAETRRGTPLALRQGVNFDDILDPYSTTGVGDWASAKWNSMKGSTGNPLANQMVVQNVIDPVTGARRQQTTPATNVFQTPQGTQNLDALRFFMQNQKNQGR